MLDPFPDLLGCAGSDAEGDEALILLRGLRSRLVEHLSTHVLSQPRAALTTALQRLANIDKLDQATPIEDNSPVLTTQQIAFHLFAHGPLEVFAGDDGLHAEWHDLAQRLTVACQVVSRAILEAGLGARVRIESGTLNTGLPNAWAAEVNANVSLTAGETFRSDMNRNFSDPLVVSAERKAFGYSLWDFYELLRDNVDELTRVIRSGDLMVVDLGAEAHPVLLDRCADFMLTPERLRARSMPSFYFAAGAGVSRSYEDVLLHAADADWLINAPLLAASYWHDGKRRPAALTTGYLLYRMASRAASSVAFRLDTATTEAKKRGPVEAGEVNRLARDFDARFEQEVAARFRSAGMSAIENLDRAGGRSLPCGEIDVVAIGGSDCEGAVLVVCEAKNTDVSFYKDFGPEQVRAKAGRATKQATRKAAWIHGHWSEVKPHFPESDHEEPVVVALIVTRAAVVPPDVEQVAAISIGEIPSIVNMLLSRPVSDWRPDIRRAITVEAAT